MDRGGDGPAGCERAAAGIGISPSAAGSSAAGEGELQCENARECRGYHCHLQSPPEHDVDSLIAVCAECWMGQRLHQRMVTVPYINIRLRRDVEKSGTGDRRMNGHA